MHGGSKITGGAYEAVLQKVDEDGDPAGVEMFMQVNPAGWDSGWMYGWYDVSANDGPCNPNSEDHSEVHTTGEDEEWHCIAAGNSYRFTLYRGSSECGTVLKSVIIEAVIVLATIAQSWRLRHEAARAPEPDPSITLRPRGGLPVRLLRRT